MCLDIALINFLLRNLGRDRLYHCIDPYKDSLKTYILPIRVLKPHEAVIESLVNVQIKDILACGYIKYPIVVDARTLTILDGHHRVETLKRLGIGYVPAFLVDYAQDYVDVYPLRKDIPVSKQSILDMAILKKSVYPPKTSRHVYYGFTILPTFTPIQSLRRISDNSTTQNADAPPHLLYLHCFSC